jgi:hypothetical protein
LPWAELAALWLCLALLVAIYESGYLAEEFVGTIAGESCQTHVIRASENGDVRVRIEHATSRTVSLSLGVFLGQASCAPMTISRSTAVGESIEATISAGAWCLTVCSTQSRPVTYRLHVSHR